MILDIPSIEPFNLSPLLYLPLKKSKKVFKNFLGSSRKRHLYLRIQSLPLLIRKALIPFCTEMTNHLFSIINPSIDVFKQTDLNTLQSCIQMSPHKQRLLKWKRIIQKTSKWNENHSVHGKYLIICAFILCYSFSENDLKVQFRLKAS
jgi:hypothetical protein